MKVLIVDDSKIIRDRIAEMISENGNKPCIAETDCKNEAIKLFNQFHPDIVILDIHLKNGNGIHLLKNIKKTKPNIIVVILSTYPSSIYQKICKDLGADFFFDKAYEFDRIQEVLNNFRINRYAKDN